MNKTVQGLLAFCALCAVNSLSGETVAARVISALPLLNESSEVSAFKVSVGPGDVAENVYVLYGQKVPDADEMWEHVEYLGKAETGGTEFTFTPSGEWTAVRFAIGEFYAKDGLIAYWDGIWNSRKGHAQYNYLDYKPENPHWENLVSKQYDFRYWAGAKDYALIGDKHLRLQTGYGYARLLADDTASTFGVVGMGGTMEVSLGCDQTWAAFSKTILRSSKDSNVALGYDYRGMICSGNNPSHPMAKGKTGASIPDVSTVAVSYSDHSPTRAVINGVSAPLNGEMSGRPPSELGEDITVLGCLHDVSAEAAFCGRVYAIRLYNRQLSLEETVRNAAADKMRFGSGEGLTVMKEGVATAVSAVYGNRVEHPLTVVAHEFSTRKSLPRYRSYDLTVGPGEGKAELWAFYGKAAPANDGCIGWEKSVKIGDVPESGATFSFAAPEDFAWRRGGYAVRFAVLEDYVSSGLISWYDGILNTRAGHSNTLTYWENLKAEKNDFKINGVIGVTDNSLWFSGTTGCYASLTEAEGYDALGFFKDQDHDTVEIALKIRPGALENATQVILKGTYENKISIASFPDERGLALVRQPDRNVPDVTRAKLCELSTISLGHWWVDNKVWAEKLFFNGADIAIGGTAAEVGAGSSGPLTLGYRGYGSSAGDQLPLRGDVYAMRVYNRPLTAAEAAQNSIVDQVRFRAGGLSTAGGATVVSMSDTMCADGDPEGLVIILE